MTTKPPALFTRNKLERIRLCVREWCREQTGRLLEVLHFPARIKEFEFVDPLTNETIFLSTGARYSVLHVGSKSFFFSRVTGRFDGTATSLEERIADRLELCD